MSVILGALVLVSIFIIFPTIKAVRSFPDWAFERAHRLPKSMWVLAGIICILPPLGAFYAMAWSMRGKAVKRAWEIGAPEAAERARQQGASEQAIRRRAYLAARVAARNEYNNKRPFGSPPAW